MKYMCVKCFLGIFYISLSLYFKLLDQNKYLYILFENRKIKTKINICFYIKRSCISQRRFLSNPWMPFFLNIFSWIKVNPLLDCHTKQHRLKSQYYEGWMRNCFAYNVGSFEQQSKRAKQKHLQVILSYWPLFLSSLYIFHLSLLIIFLLQMCVCFFRGVLLCVLIFF